MGWKADFSDADDFLRPYMHSKGTFSSGQGYTADNGWGNEKDLLIDQALLTPDGPARQAIYNQLAQMYYDDCPSFPITEPRGRRWTHYWAKGWYYDPLYPSDYYYQLFKADYPWCDISGSTLGVPDGKVNLKDLAYIVLHLNAKAPVPGQPPDPKWTGIYGCGGCDVYGDRIVDNKDIAKVMRATGVSVPDVAVTYLGTAKTIIGQGYGGNMTLTTQNQGSSSANLNVKVYANLTTAATLSFGMAGNTTEDQLLVWDTTGFDYGNYTLKGAAGVLIGEIDDADNNYTCPVSVHVGVPGDFSGSTPGAYDGRVNMWDIAYAVALFNTKPDSSNWNPNADVNNDGVVNMKDIAICVAYFNMRE